MAYTIYKYDGTVLTTIADGTIDTSTTSLNLPGPNYVGYGRFLDENLVYLLESFAGNSAPSGENLIGQLWFNKSANQLNVFTPQGYMPVSGTIISDTQPINALKGNTWYNEITGQYYYYDGTAWSLIGPAYTKLQGPSGAIPALVQDANVAGVFHNIVKIQYGGELAAIFCSDSQFVPTPAIPGFPTINPGITINNSIGYVSYNDSNVASYLPSDPTVTNIISTWQANAVAQGAEINAANAAIVTANLQLKEYADYRDTLITTAWQANAAQQTNQITAANAAIVTANSAVVSYVNTLNSAMRANVIAANASVAAANAAIVTANSAVVSYTNDQIFNTTIAWQANAAQQANQLTAANSAIVTANSAAVSYVNTLNLAMTSNITATNAAIVTANLAVVNYVNSLNLAITANVTAANASVAAANAAIVTANSAVVSYTNDQIFNTTIAWQANAAQQTNQITAANAAIVTANAAMKVYVDAQDASITSAWQANAAQQTNQITAANAAIVTANSAVVSYVNSLNSAMIANVNAANVAASNANISLKSYTDYQLTTANAEMKSYVDIKVSSGGAIAGDILPDSTANNRSIGYATQKFGNIHARTFYGNVSGVSSSALYADLAERFAADAIYPAGTVVALGGSKEVTAATTEAGEDVFGVVSENAAYLMNAGAGSNETHPAVALSGRVPVRVIGKATKGDRLIAAGKGVARVGNRNELTPFNVIGRVLENKETEEEETILAIVKLNS